MHSKIACSACARNQFRRAIVRGRQLDKSTRLTVVLAKVHDSCQRCIPFTISWRKHEESTLVEYTLTTAGKNWSRFGAIRGLTWWLRVSSVCSGYSVSRFLSLARHSVSPTTLYQAVEHNTQIRRHFITSDGGTRGHLDLRWTAAWRVDVPDDADRWRQANDEQADDDTSPQIELTLPTDRPRAGLGQSRQRRRLWKPTEPHSAANVKFRSARARYALCVTHTAGMSALRRAEKRNKQSRKKLLSLTFLSNSRRLSRCMRTPLLYDSSVVSLSQWEFLVVPFSNAHPYARAVEKCCNIAVCHARTSFEIWYFPRIVRCCARVANCRGMKVNFSVSEKC